MNEALSGVTVLELSTGVAGPFCTKILACLGAEVVKIEPPGAGDPSRRVGPFPNDEPHPEASALFLHLNTGKKSVTLDLDSPSGAALIRKLATSVDILVESFSSRAAEHMGLVYRRLREANPKLVHVSVTDFGNDGPYSAYRATDLVLYAMGGEMYGTGKPERPPIRLADYVMQYQAGNTAAAAALMTFYGAAATGNGQHIDISTFETAVSSVDRRLQYLMGYIYTGAITRREDNEWSIYPIGVYPCKDGFFDVHGGGPVNFPRACAMIGMPELVNDPRFSTQMDLIDPERKDEFDTIFLPWLVDRTREECMEAARKAKLYAAPIYTPEDVMNDPHFAFRESFTNVPHPVAGSMRYPGPPAKLTATPWRTERAPLLGEHNLEVLVDRLGLSRTELVQMRHAGTI